MAKENKLSELDVGFIDDAFNLIGDLYCAETHAINNYSETHDKSWLEIASMCRQDRSKLLNVLAPKIAEAYCLMKHISGVSVNYRELANRMISSGDIEYAKELIEKSNAYEKLFKLISSAKEV